MSSMLFELKKIINAVIESQNEGKRCVLASVVALDGSSYRKPGVRMMIREDGKSVGAVSGGCVEKEVLRQALTVFETGIPKMMTYDGRYRLGCEGIIYILIEPITISDEFLAAWNNIIKERQSISLASSFDKKIIESKGFGTKIELGGKGFTLRSDFQPDAAYEVFKHVLPPALRLILIGTEHDAVQMSLLAGSAGMEVIVVSSVKDPRLSSDFPGASQVVALEPDQINELKFDHETAIILMTHSYSRDFQFALSLLKETYCYFGIIGSMKRRDMLFDELLQYDDQLDLDKLEGVKSPAGLDIGSITPQEIAISVIAEIIATVRKKPLGVPGLSLSNQNS